MRKGEDIKKEAKEIETENVSVDKKLGKMFKLMIELLLNIRHNLRKEN